MLKTTLMTEKPDQHTHFLAAKHSLSVSLSPFPFLMQLRCYHLEAWTSSSSTKDLELLTTNSVLLLSIHFINSKVKTLKLVLSLTLWNLKNQLKIRLLLLKKITEQNLELNTAYKHKTWGLPSLFLIFWHIFLIFYAFYMKNDIFHRFIVNFAVHFK